MRVRPSISGAVPRWEGQLSQGLGPPSCTMNQTQDSSRKPKHHACLVDSVLSFLDLVSIPQKSTVVSRSGRQSGY